MYKPVATNLYVEATSIRNKEDMTPVKIETLSPSNTEQLFSIQPTRDKALPRGEYHSPMPSCQECPSHTGACPPPTLSEEDPSYTPAHGACHSPTLPGDLSPTLTHRSCLSPTKPTGDLSHTPPHRACLSPTLQDATKRSLTLSGGEDNSSIQPRGACLLPTQSQAGLSPTLTHNVCLSSTLPGGNLSNTLLGDHSPKLECPSHTLTQRSPHFNTATSLPPSSTPMDDKNEGFTAQFEAPLLNQVLIHEDLPPLLSTVLPPSYTYQFLELSWTSGSTKEEFHSRVLINVSDKDKVIEWLQVFENHNSTTYRVTRGNKFNGKKILYKTERHCQHK